MATKFKDLNVEMTVANGVTQVLWTYTVPAKSRMVLKKFGNTVAPVGAWGTVTWRIIINSVGYSPYDNVLAQIGRTEEPRPIENLELLGGDVLVINTTNLSGANADIGIALSYELQER